MIERELLINATVAVLLACLAWLHPRVAARLGRRGFVLVVAGSLVPLLDPLVGYVTSADRIALVTRAPVFATPFYGGLAIAVAGVLAAFVIPGGRAARMAAGLGAGLALHLVSALVTPVGVALLAPWHEVRITLPMLPTGHPPLLVLLLGALPLLEAAPRLRSWVWPGTAALVACYVIAGAAQYGVVSWRAGALAPPRGEVHVYPDGPWLVDWQVVVETPTHYDLRRYRVTRAGFGKAERLPRWNDEGLMLRVLGDPVVQRMYYGVFRHPVARLERTGAQITLLVQELQDQSPLVPGPTFYLERDLSGRSRFYQLQRFD